MWVRIVIAIIAAAMLYTFLGAVAAAFFLGMIGGGFIATIWYAKTGLLRPSRVIRLKRKH